MSEAARPALEFPAARHLTNSGLALHLRACSLRADEELRLAALLAFCDPLPKACSKLETISLREWQKLLRWLDFNGLALHFHDRLSEAGLAGLLPDSIDDGLERRLMENTRRTEGLLAESIAVQREFQSVGLCYAVLKGLSLWPSSFAKPQLRLQFDLDYLVAEANMPEARKILTRRGYRLYASNGRSWEFKRNEKPGVTVKEMYRDSEAFRVELHTQSAKPGIVSPLQNLEWRDFGGLAMPVLSPVDLFLGQGLHLYKHICSEFLRASYLVEFRRHVLLKYCDRAFWQGLRARTSGNTRAAIGLGISTFLITQVMGEFAPEALTTWTVRQLPPTARLWVEMYGRRAVFGDHPGSKLYVLLMRELDGASRPAARSLWRPLVPSCLPAPVIRARADESLSIRIGRYRMQLDLIFSRLRFHFVEGLRLACESHRWRRGLDLLR
jgi:Uncharacterised nucleotidyltransferase